MRNLNKINNTKITTKILNISNKISTNKIIHYIRRYVQLEVKTIF